MRRMILTSLVMLPVMAHAQSSTSIATQSSSSSAVNIAELTQPGLTTALATKSGMKVAIPASLSPVASPSFHESEKIQASQDFNDAALLKSGTMEYAMLSTPPTENRSPTVKQAVEVSLSTDELSQEPAVSKVTVHAIVDANGVPRDVAVTRSGGRVLDQRAVEAVSQYRFTPATLDNKPTWATVSIEIKLTK